MKQNENMEFNIKKCVMNHKKVHIGRLKATWLLYSLSSLLIFAKCNNSTSYRNAISRDVLVEAGCFWDIASVNSNSKISKCYQFKDDRQALYYEYDENGRRKRFDFDDLIVDHKWDLVENNILILNGDTLNVMSYKRDTMHLITKINGDSILFIRNCRR